MRILVLRSSFVCVCVCWPTIKQHHNGPHPKFFSMMIMLFRHNKATIFSTRSRCQQSRTSSEKNGILKNTNEICLVADYDIKYVYIPPGE